MIFNNIMAFLANFTLKLVTFYLSLIIGFNSSQITSRLELDRRLRNDNIEIIVLFLFTIFSYWIIGRYFLKPQKSRIKNILSVSSIAIIGILISAINFSFNSYLEPLLYIGWLQGFIVTPRNINLFMATIPFILIPSLTMGLSIKISNIKEKNL